MSREWTAEDFDRMAQSALAAQALEDRVNKRDETTRTIRQSVDRLVHAGRYGDARHLLATAVVAGVITNDDALIEFYPLVRPFSDHEHEIVQDALRSGDLGIQK